MPTIPPGYANVFARITLSGDAEEMGCTFGIAAGFGGFTQTDADNVSLACADFFRGIMGDSYTFQGVHIGVGSDPGTIVWESTAGHGVGAGGANCAPQNTAHLIRKSTATAGRGGRGRFYVPGVEETFVSNAGVLNAEHVDDVNDLGVTFLSDLSSANCEAYVLHTNEDAPSLITALTCQPLVATQRRRLR